MSDIGLRLDGLLLVAAIGLSALILAVVSLVAGVLAAVSHKNRTRRIGLAKHAAIQCAICAACLLAVIIFLDVRTGPLPATDWIDWLILPWTILFAVGLVQLIRFRGSPGNAS